jgi:hypothetical protein
VLFSDDSSKLQADERREAVVTPQEDLCEDLRRQWSAPKAASAP